MSTVQILFEQFKVLPPHLQQQLKTLVNQETREEKVPLLEQIREGMKEVRLVQKGKLQAQSLSDLLKEIDDEA